MLLQRVVVGDFVYFSELHVVFIFRFEPEDGDRCISKISATMPTITCCNNPRTELTSIINYHDILISVIPSVVLKYITQLYFLLMFVVLFDFPTYFSGLTNSWHQYLAWEADRIVHKRNHKNSPLPNIWTSYIYLKSSFHYFTTT
jgi:hypothetical protein